MKLTSDFKVYVARQWVDGATLLQEPMPFEAELLQVDGFDGEIVISGDGQELTYGDELGMATRSFCFGAVPELVAGRSQRVEHFDEGDDVVLTVDGDDVVVASPGEADVRVPRLELARALFDCGERFMTLLRRLLLKRPGMQHYVDTLTPAEEAARAALQGKAE